MRNPTAEIPRNRLHKGTVLTVGGVILACGLVVAAVAVDSWVEGKARAEMLHHCDRDVDVAHPKLPARYVPRSEVQKSLGDISGKLERLTETVEDRLPNIRTWIGTKPLPRRGRSR
jgi:hypothetical protein